MLCLFVLPLIVLTSLASAADWTQFRGPNHDGTSSEKGIATNWADGKAKIVWKVPLGAGIGTFAVAGGKAVTLVEREQQEFCIALDANTGKEAWAAPLGRTIFEKQGGDGPRSTPTIDGDKVYVLGTWLRLTCLNLSDGKEVWAKDLAETFGGAEQITTAGIKAWGCAASPVLDGDLIFVVGGGAGQALLAINKKDGSAKWKLEDDKQTHSSPTVGTIHGIRQVVFFTKSGLASVAIETGKLLWRYPFKWNVSTAIAPIIYQDIVYCSAGYGVGAGACKITKEGDGLKATELWRKEGQLINHWSTPVCVNGYLYGLYGFKEYNTEPLKCVELATGAEKWSQPGFGQGGNIVVDNHIIVQADHGDLVICEVNEKAYVEKGRVKVLSGKCWNLPAISNGRIFSRSMNEGVCVDISGK